MENLKERQRKEMCREIFRAMEKHEIQVYYQPQYDAINSRLIAEFYKYGFVGVMLDWIGHGMKGDYQEIVRKISITLHGNITNSIYNFEREKG